MKFEIIYVMSCENEHYIDYKYELIVNLTSIAFMSTHLGWPSGIGLGLGSVLLLKVSGSILSSANLRG